MLRDFGAMARFWAKAYGEETGLMPLRDMVWIANMCIDENLVPYMDPVMPEEGLRLAAAVKAALADEARAQAKADAGMPMLAGSEKQIRWAEEIRRTAIEKAAEFRRRALRRADELTAMQLDRYVGKVLRTEPMARWFIDNRVELQTFPSIIKGVPVRAHAASDMSRAEFDARVEMTIQPRVITHDGVAEILEREGLILVRYREDPDYLRIVRACRLRWDPDVMGWRGRKEWGKVPVSEQMARLAAVLLGEGFAVMMSDDVARSDVRAQALAGAAAPPESVSAGKRHGNVKDSLTYS